MNRAGRQQLALPWLTSPADHAGALHPVGVRGLVAIATAADGWRERNYRPDVLPWVCQQLTGQSDAYVSQSRFKGRRSIANLVALGALWVDLDPGHAIGRHWNRDRAAELVTAARLALEDAHLPAPGVAISTGRGVHLVWRHAPVPRAVLPRWRACQDRLLDVLRHLGADPQVTDAARVLRLVGTTNSRAAAATATVEALTPLGPVWSFDALAVEILPLTRRELAELRSLRVARKRREHAARPAQQLTLATYGEKLLDDLQKLRAVRWLGGIPAGQRDGWLFPASVAMAWLVSALELPREIEILAHQAGTTWSAGEVRSRMSAVVARAHAAARGEVVEHDGIKYDPRYRFRASTLVRRLGITDDEMRRGDLVMLLSPELRRERRAGIEQAAARAGKRRRGLRARAEYLAQLAETKSRVTELLA